MKIPTRLVIACMALTLPPVDANHADPCVVVSADPASIFIIMVPGMILYDEERGNPFGFPIPLSATFFGPDRDGNGMPEPLKGQGSWVYEEGNGLQGLQRGGIGLLGDHFPPGCDFSPDWKPTDGTAPCLIRHEDPITDESCHAGPDYLMT